MNRFHVASRHQRQNNRHTPLTLEALERRATLTATGFVETNLASDIKGVAEHTDKDLINPWGFFVTADGQFRISANGVGNSPLLNDDGVELGRAAVIPPPGGSAKGVTSAPTGDVANTTADFVIASGKKSSPATVIFATEDGTIAAFNPAVSKDAIIVADQSAAGAVYKAVNIGTFNGENYLFATNFHNGTIDVFDKNFQLVHLPGSFTDPNAPPPAPGQPGFAPFGIHNINGTLFVTFALQKADQHDDQEGPGNGFIDEFDTGGNFIKRFVSGTAAGGTLGQLNSPFGAAVAPANFGPNGEFSGALLIGNFGDSHVSAFNIKTGAFLGQLSDPQGHVLTLNGGIGGSNTKGLWAIHFGNGHGGSSTNALYFTAGVNDEADGLFGMVTMNRGDKDHDDQGNGHDSVFSLDDVFDSQTARRGNSGDDQHGALPHAVQNQAGSTAHTGPAPSVSSSGAQSNPLAFAPSVRRMSNLNATDLAFGELDSRGMF
jgi:uncharacterized protein (TIGR03118 family)